MHRYTNYQEFLLSDEWHELRDEAKRRANYRCEECGKRDGEQHVHHTTYKYGWLCPVQCLQLLCKDCHEARHATSLRELAKIVANWQPRI